jgi:hypothetical protein
MSLLNLLGSNIAEAIGFCIESRCAPLTAAETLPHGPRAPCTV